MSNAFVLEQVMRAHGLTRQQVADLIGVSRQTINSWLTEPGRPSYRKMPDTMRELLEFKIRALKK